MNREKSLLKNTIIIGFGTLLPRLASFITLPLITAGLSKDELGTYDLITTLVTLFLPLVTLQLSTAAFRFLVDNRNNNRECKIIISSIMGFVTISALCSLFILFIVLWKFDFFVRILIVVYYFFDIFLINFQQIARGLGLNKYYSFSSVIQALVNMILIVFFIVHIDGGLIGVLLSCTVATFLGAGYLFFVCNIYRYINFSYIRQEKLKELLRYSWPMIPNALSLWVLSVSDRLVLTIFIGVGANAVYYVANKIPSLLTAAQNTFIYAWQENASIVAKDSDVDMYYSKIFSGTVRMLAGILALIIGVTPFLFTILIKGDYSDAYPHMNILFMAIFFSCISSFLGGIYVAKKKTLNVGITTIISAVLNLLIDLSFVGIIGIYAASISTLASYLFLMIYRMKNVQRFQNIKYNIMEMVIVCSVLIVMCILSEEEIGVRTIINLIIGLFFAIVINYKLLKTFKKKAIKTFQQHKKADF